ncbi:MAG: LPS export ABC transporter periplasmic protein LptC [Rhizobiaceae bacterium]|nr:LPS export ABC transporter periplasmic protein LptC [Rhizobiaceae bacterium]
MTDATYTDMRERRAAVTETAFLRERRHSSRIRILRRALPGAALLILALFVASSVATSLTGVSIDLAGTRIEGGKLVMTNPKMGGFTSSSRPYEVIAERAIQDITRTESVDLEGIAARLPVGTGEWAQVDAATGTLFRDSSRLSINSPVLITTTDGMEARMKSADIEMGTGDIYGREHVEIDTGGSHVVADSLKVTGGGAVMIFENNVKMTIEPERVKTASADDGTNDASN